MLSCCNKHYYGVVVVVVVLSLPLLMIASLQSDRVPLPNRSQQSRTHATAYKCVIYLNRKNQEMLDIICKCGGQVDAVNNKAAATAAARP